MRKYLRNTAFLFLIIIAFSHSFLDSYAQSESLGTNLGQDERVKVISSVDPASILVGEQSKLKIEVVVPKGSSIQIHLPNDTIVTGVEYLRAPALVDSVSISDDIIRYNYEVPITSFDSATYVLNNVSALVNNSLYNQTEPPLLHATTFQVNVDKPEEFFGIKENWKAPFVWQDYLYILYIILGLGIVGLIVYFIVQKVRNKGDKKEVELVTIDPYKEAKGVFSQLKEQELWKKGGVKQHYTILTDALRLYIQRTLNVSTLDKTTSEIISQVKDHPDIAKDNIEQLRFILSEADLVKFAKYQPTDQENYSSLTRSDAWVDSVNEAHLARMKQLELEQKELQQKIAENTSKEKSEV